MSLELPAPSFQPSSRRILWTGGFDSTALVVMALQAGDRVEPHWIEFDPSWQKQRRERDARDRIRARLPADLAARLAPDQVITFQEFGKRTLELDRELYQTKRWRAGALEAAGFSPQVPGLVAVAEQLQGLEAGYVAGDTAIVDTDQRRALERVLRLPLAHVSKRELLEAARRGGWLELMELTWSCEGEDFEAEHQACGRCLPCRGRIIGATVRAR